MRRVRELRHACHDLTRIPLLACRSVPRGTEPAKIPLMANRLFHVLVLSSIPAANVGCGEVAEPRPGVDGSGGEHSATGGEHSGTGGEHTSSGAAPGSGGGLIIVDPATGGLGGSFPDPADLDCPSEQWVCAELECAGRDWQTLSQCSCDPERPQAAEDCSEGEQFLCHHFETDAGTQHFSCVCSPVEVSTDQACREALIVVPSSVWLREGSCECAYLIIK